MGVIKEFNQICNRSSKRHDLWKTYRNTLTSYIIDKIDKNPNKINNLLIIAAGNCDDLDISKIHRKTTKLYLSDIDIQALKKAVSTYSLIDKNIKLLQTEYTGLDKNNIWNNFVKTIITLNNVDDINKYLDKLKDQIISHQFLSNYINYFDLIIVSPIYTQLLFQQLLNYLTMLANLNYPLELIDHIKSYFLDFMPIIIHKFNQNILKLLKNNGMLIVISDIFEFNKNTELYKEVYPLLNSKITMDKYYEDYHKKYGFGLGDFGLYDLEEELSINTYEWIEWPFSKNKSMIVKIVTYN